jgi:P-aminobenzoate N-oxygenase AurF
MAHADISLVKQLSANSGIYHDPLTRLDWAALSVDDYWLPPSALSLHGIAEFEQLPEDNRKRLSQYEFLSFVQSGLWLEGIFLERLARQLHGVGDPALQTYCLHEIREEAGHGLMFLQLMAQSKTSIPPSLRQFPRFAHLVGRFAPMGGAMFWLAVVIGEEIPDKLNRQVRLAENTAVNPLVRQMCRLHLMDEARHIAHARSTLTNSLKHCGKLETILLSRIASILLKQFTRSFYLPEEAVYELAGLAPGKKWRELARQNPVRQEFVRCCVEPTLNLLRNQGIALDMPTL